MLPHFCGCTYPDSNPFAKGAVAGLSLDTKREDIAAAIYESIAFMLLENIQYMAERDVSASRIVSLGGGARSDIWMKIKADITGMPVLSLKNEESTTLGCAFSAAVGAGWYNSVKDIHSVIKTRRQFDPCVETLGQYMKKYTLYRSFYGRVKDLYQERQG